MKAQLQRLRAEIRSDREAIGRHFDEIAATDELDEASRGELARLAVALHHAYTGVETIMVRVARALEGEEPSGPDWHKQLLEEMGLELDGIRPAVLSASSLEHLRMLLGFRHFFRHAYTADLDVRRLAELRDHAVALRSHLDGDLDALDELLSRLADATGT